MNDKGNYSGISRRTVLKAAGAAAATSILQAPFVHAATRNYAFLMTRRPPSRSRR